MVRSIFMAVLLGMLFVCGANAAEVKNDAVRQEGNRVVITYDLEGKENEADVTLSLTIEGRKYTQKDLHLEGDVGKVKTGKGKKIYWNALQDFPRGLSEEITWGITTGGGKRFRDNGNGTVTDNKTGLMWVKSLDGKKRTWQKAMDYADNLSFAGYTDWRLPTIDEFKGLISEATNKEPNDWLINTHSFSNVQSTSYWSSSTYADGTDFAWGVSVWRGFVYFYYKTYNYYVWPVRAGQ